jgi:hypothetical protein
MIFLGVNRLREAGVAGGFRDAGFRNAPERLAG